VDAARRVIPMRRASRLALAAAVGLALATASGWRTTAQPVAAVSLLAVPDTLTVIHDHATNVPAPGVLKNDITVLGTTAVLDTQPSHGSVVLKPSGSYAYNPDPAWVGVDVFKYHDFDGLLPTNTTTVTITVLNHAPVAQDDRESANAGRKEVVSAPGVLENDDDPDGDELQAKLVDGPSHGAVTFRADGSFDYTADPGFDGDDVFTYVATDGIAKSDPARVTMHVSASGSTPRPSSSPPPPPPPTPTPTPVPTPTPTPTPILPLPTVTLPPLPLPSLFATPRPSPTPSPRPGESVIPSPSPSVQPGASVSPSDPGSSQRPGSITPPGSGSSGSGGPGGDGGSGGGGPASGSAGATGSATTGAAGSTGGGIDADGPTFSIAGDAPDPVVPMMDAAFAGFDGIDWAVPALTMSVPGLLLMLAVLAQLTASAIWLPMTRRWLGAFGVGRRRRGRGTAGRSA